ncbi:dachshund homolog 1 isoform X2 [Folsomia candida]|uniref:dachshund homolog 1 isoform X2 n=1 Tax=Folsomia candida TaxID=158441 RepID=UPI0016051A8E|nr:dachshund homolog 1 isoform X2 [Folsomia candida]
MLMKIDQMESGGSSGEDVTSPTSRGSLSPLPLNRGSSMKQPYSPPMDRGSPLCPPKSLAAQHMMNSIVVSSAKNMTPGILASLNALNAMSTAAAAASFHHHDFGGNNSYGDRGLDRHPYGSPPAPMAPTNDPSANECKLVEYRGQKVAAFVINGDTMLCLPQAFELFLKHLVGGLHTVYTKLKRLDIVPLVCNVEQVRILRGLGAIQPGVNRCKLLSCKDFDILYKDCTTARPGRPPKRTSVPLVPISQHGGQFLSMKKHRLENGDYDYPHHHGHHNPADLMSLEKSPLLANGYNHPPTQLPPMHLLPSLAGQSAAALAAHAALFSPSGLPMPPGHHPRDGRSGPMQTLDAVAARNATWETCRSAYEDFVKQFESRYQEDCSDSEKSSPRSPTHEAGSGEGLIRNGNAGGSPVLNLSKNMPEDVSDSDENAADGDYDSDNEPPNGNGVSSDTGLYDYGERSHSRKSSQPNELKSPSEESGPPHHQQHHHHHHDPLNASPFTEVSAAEAAISSTENLLRNIQGLLKVAAENAKQQERRISLEKAEFKMEIMRERELRVQLEKQLVDERNLRTYFERRWKKERRMRKRLEGDQCSSMSRSTESHSPYSQNQHNNSHQQQVSPLMSSRGGGGEHRHEKADQQQSSGGGDKCPPASDPSGGGKSTPCTNGSTSLKGESSDR